MLCKDCVHYHPTKAGAGECRESPPKVILIGHTNTGLQTSRLTPVMISAFAEVNEELYCGKFFPVRHNLFLMKEFPIQRQEEIEIPADETIGTA